MRNAIGCLVGSLLSLVACTGKDDGGTADATGGTSPVPNGGTIGRGGSATSIPNAPGGSGATRPNDPGGATSSSGGVATTSDLGRGGRDAPGGADNVAGNWARGGAATGSSSGKGGQASGTGGSAARSGGGTGAASGSAVKGGSSSTLASTTRGGSNAGGQSSRGGTATRGGAAGNGSGVLGGAAPGGASSTTTAVSGAGGTPGSCGEATGQLFGTDHPWNQRIDAAPLDSESAAIVAYLQQNHTSSQRFRVDGPSDEPDNLYGITLLSADASTPHQDFTPTDDFYSPDCDPAPVPIPAAGAIEGESSYACTNDGDCHLIVIDRAECRLYEMWRTNRSSASSFDGGCLAVWDLRETYRAELRGDCCTSADAAGLPIAAHLFSPDEIAAGRIEHAIRFILPNNLMRKLIYVRPATHSTSATSGSASAPPYGTRMRLKASFDESKLKPAARVVARALKEYGMILSDGGNITFTATNDRFTTHKWSEVDFMPSDLTGLQWNDFEVPELGTRYAFDNACDCNRTPITK